MYLLANKHEVGTLDVYRLTNLCIVTVSNTDIMNVYRITNDRMISLNVQFQILFHELLLKNNHKLIILNCYPYLVWISV